MSEVLETKIDGFQKLLEYFHDELKESREDHRQIKTTMQELSKTLTELKIDLSILQTGHRTMIFIGTIIGSVAGWFLSRITF